jgi:transposase
MEPDMSATAAIHKRLAVRGLVPAKHFVDSGYVDADLLVSSRRDHGISLEGPVRKISTWASRVGQGYDLPNFKIDWDRNQVICPQGKVSTGWTPAIDDVGQPRIHARFGRADCGGCKARSLCTQAKAAGRSLYFHPRAEYEALNNARARMNDPVWKEEYRTRAGVEGTLSQGVRTFGMRQSRYIGFAKTALQQVFTAVGINAARVVGWLDERPRAKTRISPFAKLAPKVS